MEYKFYSENVLRQGYCKIDEQIETKEHCIRIRIYSYEGYIVYHKMIDGEVVKCEKIGVQQYGI